MIMPKRESVNPEKLRAVEDLSRLIEKYPVIALINLHKLPTKALQKIKREMDGKGVLRVSKKSALLLALEKTSKKNLKDYLELQTALLLTDINPFKLSVFLGKSKSTAPAKAGDVVTRNIEIKAGPTDLPPGPAITTLTKVGIPAKVEGGKISIMRNKVVCKAGETVSTDLAAALNLLKMEPMEISLNLIAAFDEGRIYKKNELFFDIDKFLLDIALAYQQGLNLSLNSGYITKETIGLMLAKAVMQAKSLITQAKLEV